MSEEISLFSWIKNSYLKKILIPLVIFQMIIFVILIGYNILYKNLATKNLYDDNIYKINNILKFEENQLNLTLGEIEKLTRIYSIYVKDSLLSKKAANLELLDRLKYSGGKYYTYKNSNNNDGMAVLYTGFYPISEKEKLKVLKLGQVESTMRNILKENKIVSSIYFNTFDSLNIIYPYFDVIAQYGSMDDITKYNFYYEADAKNNPQKNTVWTNAYLDPAGHGWMISSIFPVYNNDFLEGVVGLDVTLETITSRIINTVVPWDGYMMIVDNTGTILAIPPKGEEDFHIKELKKHIYNESIKQDTFKPEDFSVTKNKKFESLNTILSSGSKGNGEFFINDESKIISWTTIEGTSWKLLIVSDKNSLLKELENFSAVFYTTGFSLLLIFILMQTFIFIILNERVKKIGYLISSPLVEMNNAIIDIGNEIFNTKIKNTEIKELNKTIIEIHKLSQKLENNIFERQKAQKKLFEYQSSLENIIEERTESLTKINRELRELQSQIIQREKLASIGQLAAGISHEINNPMGFIQSNFDALRQYYDEYRMYINKLEEYIPSSYLKEVNKYKRENEIDFMLIDTYDIFKESIEGIERIINIVKNLKDFSNLDEESRTEDFDINKSILISLDIVNFEYSGFLKIEKIFSATNLIHASSSEINQIVMNLLRNAIYSVKLKHLNDNDGFIEIITKNADDGIEFSIIDNGEGIDEKFKGNIFSPFFTTKPQGMGSGLGLYVAYDVIVNRYGGVITFDTLDKKTCFTVKLPRLSAK